MITSVRTVWMPRRIFRAKVSLMCDVSRVALTPGPKRWTQAFGDIDLRAEVTLPVPYSKLLTGVALPADTQDRLA